MTNSSPHYIASPRSAQRRQGCGWLRRLGLALLTPLALSLSLTFSLVALQATAQTTNSIHTPTAAVGEVSLVLGRAYLERDNDRERIEAGSKERMRKPGSKGAPTAAAFKASAKTAKKK